KRVFTIERFVWIRKHVINQVQHAGVGRAERNLTANPTPGSIAQAQVHYRFVPRSVFFLVGQNVDQEFSGLRIYGEARVSDAKSRGAKVLTAIRRRTPSRQQDNTHKDIRNVPFVELDGNARRTSFERHDLAR